MDPLQLAGAITAVTAALAAVGWAGRLLHRVGKSVSELHDDWLGEPDRPGVPGRKGVMTRLHDIETELHTQGGRLTEHLRSHSPAPVQVQRRQGGTT